MHGNGNTRVVYTAWDKTTRIFHWVNALCVLALAIFGLAILNDKLFGVSDEGKILLKTLHTYIGYIFALNLAWRLIWAFVGSKNARWKGILPFSGGFTKSLGEYVRRSKSGNPPSYVGHNPLGKLMVTALLALLFVQASTGLVLAGTDLYKPPFGHLIAKWVTDGDEARLSKLTPGSTEFADPESYDQMRAFRKPIVRMHEYSFYVLMAAILLHIASVVVAEIRERSGLVSAMISGQKALSSRPVDDEPETPPDES
jgi:cytochrome b